MRRAFTLLEVTIVATISVALAAAALGGALRMMRVSQRNAAWLRFYDEMYALRRRAVNEGAFIRVSGTSGPLGPFGPVQRGQLRIATKLTDCSGADGRVEIIDFDTDVILAAGQSGDGMCIGPDGLGYSSGFAVPTNDEFFYFDSENIFLRLTGRFEHVGASRFTPPYPDDLSLRPWRNGV